MAKVDTEVTPKKKLSLIKWMVMMNIVTVAIVAGYMALTINYLVKQRTNDDYKEIASATSVNIANMLDSLSDEDFTYDEETDTLRKGDIVITDEAFSKSLKFNENIHHTIFWGNVRVLTDVTDNDGNLVTGTVLQDQNIIDTIKKEGVYNENNVLIYGSKYSVCYYPIKNGNTVVGYIFTGVNQDEANKHIVTDTLFAILVSVILTCILLYFVTKAVNKRSQVFDGELKGIIALVDKERDNVSKLGHETNENMGQINSAISQMSQAVTDTANNTESVMMSMSDFGNSIEDIMGQVSESTNIAKSSKLFIDDLSNELTSLENASKANSEEIVNISKQIEEDNKAVDSIGQIVKMINDIAFQITLLSFNASVEAARAGEAGKGFAVVAESIKNLSDKTQLSVNEITELIGSINKKMALTGDASLNLMKKNETMIEALATTKEKMSSVNDAFDKITGSIEVVQEESQSILYAKNKVIETLSSFAATSEENAAMSEQIASTSNVVISITNSLMEKIDGLKVINDGIDKVKNDFM